VRIDGREVGKLPLPTAQRVAAGSVVVEMRAAGYFPMSRTIPVLAGKLTRETMMLPPADSSKGSAESSRSAGSAIAADHPPETMAGILPATATTTGSESATNMPVQPAATNPRANDDGTPHGSWQRPLAWTLAVGAGAFAGGGVAALVVRNGKASDYNRLVEANGCGGSNANVCADLKSSGNRAGTLAVVGFGFAGAMAITSTILFLTAPRAPAAMASALRGCGIDGTTVARLVACDFVF
jgi:hypothetical protein